MPQMGENAICRRQKEDDSRNQHIDCRELEALRRRGVLGAFCGFML